MTDEPAQPNPLYDELLWVHAAIRRDLGIVEELAKRAAAGLGPEEISVQVGELQTNGPLWQLKVNCLHYCTFVHHHHRFEDAGIFPTLRRVEPAIGPVVDKLEADHRDVAALLEAVEEKTEALNDAERPEVRSELVTALEALAEILLAHLEFEERSLEPVLAKMSGWWG